MVCPSTVALVDAVARDAVTAFGASEFFMSVWINSRGRPPSRRRTGSAVSSAAVD